MKSLPGHWFIIWQLVKTEVKMKYRGSFLGLFWSVLTPLLMLAIYVLIFGYVFKGRNSLPAPHDTQLDFAIFIFCGVVIFNYFSEVINRAPTIILANPNYVKKVVFPLETLAVVTLGTASFQFIINLFTLMVLLMITKSEVHWQVILIVPIWLSFSFLLLGLVWIFSALGAYIRDISHVLGFVITGLMFLSPLFYSVDRFPEKYRTLLYLNPVTYVIESSREVLFYGNALRLGPYLVFTLFSIGALFLGWIVFEKLKKGFADVI